MTNAEKWAIIGAATEGPCKAYRDDGSHILRIGTAIQSKSRYESHHIIRYEHSLYPEDGKQYQEAEANSLLMAAAFTEWPKDLERLERMEKALQEIIRIHSGKSLTPFAAAFKMAETAYNALGLIREPDCKLGAVLGEGRQMTNFEKWKQGFF